MGAAFSHPLQSLPVFDKASPYLPSSKYKSLWRLPSSIMESILKVKIASNLYQGSCPIEYTFKRSVTFVLNPFIFQRNQNVSFRITNTIVPDFFIFFPFVGTQLVESSDNLIKLQFPTIKRPSELHLPMLLNLFSISFGNNFFPLLLIIWSCESRIPVDPMSVC